MRFLFPIVIAASLLGCDTSSTNTRKTESSTDSTDQPIVADPVLADPATVQVNVGEPSHNSPVAVGAALDRNKAVVNGQAQLVIRAKIADGWHIYAADGPTGVGRPTKCVLKLPSGIMAGQWSLPEAELKDSSQGPVGMYHDEVLLSVPLTISANVRPGEGQIECEFHYQPCTDQQCLRPTATKLVVPILIAVK